MRLTLCVTRTVASPLGIQVLNYFSNRYEVMSMLRARVASLFGYLKTRDQKVQNKRRLRFDGLEARALLATFNVTTTDDGGLGSLRQAIIDANALPGPDTIRLQDGRYSLSLAGPLEDLGATGDLDISDDLTISGNAEINANNIDRVFHIHGATVHFSGVTIRGGYADKGGGILNEGGDVRLSFSQVISNSARGTYKTDDSFPVGSFAAGGGIYSAGGSVLLLHSTLGVFGEFNVAVGGTQALGGGLYAENSQVSVSHSKVNSNRSSHGGDPSVSRIAAGAGIFVKHSALTVTDSDLEFNLVTTSFGTPTGEKAGGAVYALNSHITMTNSAVRNNELITSTSPGDLKGAGVFVHNSTMFVANSQFFENVIGGSVSSASSALGGAIYSASSSVNIVSANFYGNVARVSHSFASAMTAHGGAIYALNSQFDVTSSSFTFNHAVSRGSSTSLATGGAISIFGGQFNATNCIMHSNASDGGSGSGRGGAVYVDSGLVLLNQCDISFNSAVGNTAGLGGGVYVAGGTVTIRKNTEVEDNLSSTFGDDDNIFID
jgi:hypothetical protein